MQVQSRTQHHITAILQCLITNGLTHLFHQLRVPCRSQTGAHRKTCGIVRLGVALTNGVDVYASRSVCQYRSRDAQSRNGYRQTSSTSHQFLLVAHHGTRAYKSVITSAHQQLGLLI